MTKKTKKTIEQKKVGGNNLKSKYRNLLLLILMFWFFISIAALALQNSLLVTVSRDQNDVYDRSFAAQKASLGFGCGLLTDKKAKQFLAGDVSKTIINTPSVFYARIDHNKPDLESGLNESCVYHNKDNNQKFVSLSLVSYSSPQKAAAVFDYFLKAGQNQAFELAQVQNQRVIYSNEGFMTLQQNRIFSVNASNGNSSENEAFTRPIFEQLMSEIQQ